MSKVYLFLEDEYFGLLDLLFCILFNLKKKINIDFYNHF